MKKNMSVADRVIRLLLAAVFVALVLTSVITGVWGTVLLVVAAIFLLTAAVGFCPLYRLFGISSRPAGGTAH